MDSRAIGVFDSGLGGLTAVSALRELLPGEDVVYFGDTGRVPYGTRSAETIFRYAAQDVRFLLRPGLRPVRPLDRGGLRHRELRGAAPAAGDDRYPHFGGD